MQGNLADSLKSKYIICSCEGTAEQEAINILLDNGMLLFSRDDLVGKAVTRLRTAEKITEQFLHREYGRDVCILRILDSRKERFKLGKLYAERYPVHNIITSPEIEMLIIISEGLIAKYLKSSQRKKPSVFAKEHMRCDIKSEGFWNRYYGEDPSKLVYAIEEYNKSFCLKGEYNLSSLLK